MPARQRSERARGVPIRASPASARAPSVAGRGGAACAQDRGLAPVTDPGVAPRTTALRARTSQRGARAPRGWRPQATAGTPAGACGRVAAPSGHRRRHPRTSETPRTTVDCHVRGGHRTRQNTLASRHHPRHRTGSTANFLRQPMSRPADAADAPMLSVDPLDRPGTVRIRARRPRAQGSPRPRRPKLLQGRPEGSSSVVPAPSDLSHRDVGGRSTRGAPPVSGEGSGFGLCEFEDVHFSHPVMAGTTTQSSSSLTPSNTGHARIRDRTGGVRCRAPVRSCDQ